MNAPKTHLVFIPGWGFKASVWKNVSASLNIPAILLELPLLENNENILENFHLAIETMNSQVPENAILIGWSLGGLIAIQFCHRYPHKIRHLILMNSTPRLLVAEGWNGVTKLWQKKLLTHFQKDPHHFLIKFIDKILFPYQKIDFKNYLEQQLLKHKTHLKNYFNLLFLLDLRKIFSALPLKVSSIFGESDLILPVEMIDDIRKLHPQNVIYIIPNGSHIPFLTQRSVCIKKLKAIIQVC
jgi:pimeloyl-[acyl-carrier protein] methyl ester esterase